MLWPSEESISSYLNTERPQQKTHFSYRGEPLGWGLCEDLETAGITAAREAHTGAESRSIQQLDPREQLSHYGWWSLCILQSRMGLNSLSLK